MSESHDEIVSLGKQLDKVLDALGEPGSSDKPCPSSVGLKDSPKCMVANCRTCWEDALSEME